MVELPEMFASTPLLNDTCIGPDHIFLTLPVSIKFKNECFTFVLGGSFPFQICSHTFRGGGVVQKRFYSI